MNSMPLPSIPIPSHCFQRYLFLIHRLRNAGGVLFYRVIYPVQSTFLLGVAFILVVPWRSRFAARWNLPSNARKVVSITRPATSLRRSPLQLLKSVTPRVKAGACVWAPPQLSVSLQTRCFGVLLQPSLSPTDGHEPSGCGARAFLLQTLA